MYTRGNMNQNNIFDVIVIGGGPAGMMAAAKAGERSRRVLLLEKNPHVGKKLLITGGGRCNVTNNKPVPREMLAAYKSGGKFLFSTFTQHGVADSITWFKERGVELKEENEGRLFPTTNTARTICDVLVQELKKTDVVQKTRASVKTVTRNKKSGGFTITLESGEMLECQSCVIATGGTSRPETGSTGDAYVWLKKLGHTVVPNNFALVPLTLKNSWTKKLSGLTLPDIKLTLFADNKKQSVHKGKLLFTHVGVTGPTILNLSKTVGELLAHSSVTLMLDLFPNKDAGELKVFLRALFAEHSNKKVKNVLSDVLPSTLVTELLKVLSVDPATVCHSLSTEARTSLLILLKAIPLEVKGLLGADKAVVSSGGVSLSEINFKTMESKIVPHIYVVGDMLNIDRPSGGYSLQLCWSTGYVAGSAV
jgi:predicted Rossmann fold flavoprotein